MAQRRRPPTEWRLARCARRARRLRRRALAPGLEHRGWNTGAGTPGLEHRSTLVPASVEDIMLHLSESERTVHPADRTCHGEQRDLLEAVQTALRWGDGSQTRRAAVWHKVDEVQRALRPCTDRCYEHMPEHVMGMPDPNR